MNQEQISLPPTTRVLDPQVTVQWLENNALWLVAAALLALFIWRKYK